MQRTAVFVDAGYVFAQGSVLLTGAQQRRELLALDITRILNAIRAVVTDQSSFPLLRVYWYDAMRLGQPTREQMTLADAPDIKTRLGQVNAAGEQKGVDALIITDMAELARNHAISDAVLISGDEDVRVGVVLAQQFGVRVHLVGIKPSRGNQSRSLQQEADTTTEWDEAVVGAFLTFTPPAGIVVPLDDTSVDGLVGALVADLLPAALPPLRAQFMGGNHQIPSEHDRALLRLGRSHFGRPALDQGEKTLLRQAFVRLVIARSDP